MIALIFALISITNDSVTTDNEQNKLENSVQNKQSNDLYDATQKAINRYEEKANDMESKLDDLEKQFNEKVNTY